MSPQLPPQCQDMTIACRWTYWNVEGMQPIMYGLMAIAVAIFAGRLWMRVQAWRQGKGDLPFDYLPERVRRVLKYVVGQSRVLRDRIPGVMHLAIFAGFTIFFIGTVLATLDADVTLPLLNIKLLSGTFYLFYKLVLDSFSLFFMIGLTMAMIRRFSRSTNKLTYNAGFTFILFQLWLFVLTGLLLEGLRLGYMDAFYGAKFWWGQYSIASYWVGQAILALSPTHAWNSPEGIGFLNNVLIIHRVTSWIHTFQVFA